MLKIKIYIFDVLIYCLTHIINQFAQFLLLITSALYYVTKMRLICSSVQCQISLSNIKILIVYDKMKYYDFLKLLYNTYNNQQ